MNRIGSVFVGNMRVTADPAENEAEPSPAPRLCSAGLVRDADYYVMDVTPMVFYFFKSPGLATLFKLTFAGM